MTRAVSWNKRYHQLQDRIGEIGSRLAERIDIVEATMKDSPPREQREYRNIRATLVWQRDWISLLYEILENQNRLYQHMNDQIETRDGKITDTLKLILKWKNEYEPILDETKHYFEDKAGRIIRP